MKKTIALIISLMLLCVSLSSCLAGPGELEFTLSDDGTSYEVSRGTCKEENVVIPSTHEGLPVTKIADRAFAGSNEKTPNTRLKSITIPDSIIDIGIGAFRYCEALTAIEIPNSVTHIYKEAFMGCKSLKDLKLGNSIIEIEPWAFDGCISLKKVHFPSSITSSLGNAFLNCSNLEELTVDPGNPDFYSKSNCVIFFGRLDLGCKNSVIPDEITSIDSAFVGCTGITSVNIPAGVNYISEDSFSGCIGLERISVSKGNSTYYDQNDCIIEKETKKLVVGCKNSVIPQDIVYIGNHAFDGCTEITEIVIPNSVVKISPYAFNECSNLVRITIPGHIDSLSTNTLQGCEKLTDIIFKGTKSQWESVKKGNNWNLNTGNYTVHCTDGDIVKN